MSSIHIKYDKFTSFCMENIINFFFLLPQPWMMHLFTTYFVILHSVSIAHFVDLFSVHAHEWIKANEIWKKNEMSTKSNSTPIAYQSPRSASPPPSSNNTEQIVMKEQNEFLCQKSSQTTSCSCIRPGQGPVRLFIFVLGSFHHCFCARFWIFVEIFLFFCLKNTVFVS